MSDQTNDTPPQGGTEPDALDLLAAEAEGLQGASQEQREAAQQRKAQQQAQAAQGEAEANAATILSALQMARMMAAPAFKWWPDFGECWSDTQLMAISSAGAQVMQKHGLSMGEMVEQWGPYIALGMATIPPALTTRAALQAHREEQRRQAPPRPMGPVERAAP